MKMCVASNTVLQRLRSEEVINSGANPMLIYKFIPPFDGEILIAADIHSSSGGTAYLFAYTTDTSVAIATRTNLDWRTSLGTNILAVGGADSITCFSTTSSTYVNMEAVITVTKAQPVYLLLNRSTTSAYIQNLEIYWNIVEV